MLWQLQKRGATRKGRSKVCVAAAAAAAAAWAPAVLCNAEFCPAGGPQLTRHGRMPLLLPLLLLVQEMVCIEPAVATLGVVVVAPGMTWSGKQMLACSKLTAPQRQPPAGAAVEGAQA